MPGMKTLETITNIEFFGPGSFDRFLFLPISIEAGSSAFVAGSILGRVPTTGLYKAYNNSAVASATSPVAGGENTGDGTCSSVSVNNNTTLTENWTLACTAEAENGGTFSVVGSVSGNVGNASVGTEFSDSTGKIAFTISDGSEDFDVGDTFTFSTVRAEAITAECIALEAVNASEEIVNIPTTGIFHGTFIAAKLTGLDSSAVSDMDGRYLRNDILSI